MRKHLVLMGASSARKTTLALKLSNLGYLHYKMDSIKSGIYNNFVLKEEHN